VIVPSDAHRVAVLGCGSGRLAIGIALALPDATVAGFDADSVAIGTARRCAALAGVADRVTFEVSDSVLGQAYDLVCARAPRSAQAPT
jgi:methylase of polypeptide subunit release factors